MTKQNKILNIIIIFSHTNSRHFYFMHSASNHQRLPDKLKTGINYITKGTVNLHEKKA